MTDHDTNNMASTLTYIENGARFSEVPASLGDGTVLLSSQSAGCVVIAPPWSAIAAGEDQHARTTWRAAFFAADDLGTVDLDDAPESCSSVKLEELLGLAALAEHRGYLRSGFLTRAEHYVRMAKRLEGEARTRARDQVSSMRTEWARAYPGDPWPFALAEPARARLAEALAATGARILAKFAASSPTYQPVLGPTAASAEKDSSHRSFGPGASLRTGDNGVFLVLEFDVLARTQIDTSMVGGGPLTAYLLDPEDGILASVQILDASGTRHVPLAVSASSVAEASLRMALATGSSEH